MKIVSSARLKTSIKNKLTKNYPDLNFYFFKDMEEASEDVYDADVLITYGEDVTNEMIIKSKNLKWVMVISAGLDQMPLQAIKEKGILVTNARGIHKIPMAEYTLAMMLQVSRQAKQLMKNEQERIWDRRVPMLELNDKTVGILGTGAIGSEIAKYCRFFNMNTIGFNRSGRRVDEFDQIVTLENINELLHNSDFIVSVLPSTPDTDGMINEKLINEMKEGVVLINIGRGKNIVEADLIAALDGGNLAHAVLDVFTEEPLPEKSPFWGMDNVTVTPHLSGISPHYQPRAFAIFEKNLNTFLKGGKDFINKVDVNRGY
ncbi:D-2-hydroxyacid dehydrogenase [Anaerobacillus arseniciselenatis]|uniref:D-2-hydroxyacid dehydrogenase n=1 Tax=Anaerobacillus arseniciselenatis TaxID=85682 RepID=A0A1S2LPL0_9BACI|nr:D-2-hydroxyacid dehydrogenase [Anaerobacillus arseniciselenatis]OIJ14294.1 D-2-hydroxyacid dehydrogenase [Anaerobacillus arseniciselenatis]